MISLAIRKLVQYWECGHKVSPVTDANLSFSRELTSVYYSYLAIAASLAFINTTNVIVIAISK